MKRIYDDLKAFISPEMTASASRLLEEQQGNVTSASSSIIASLLGVMLKKGDTQQIENILKESGKLNLLGNVSNVWEEKPTQEQQRVGDDFLQHLLGDKAADFTTPIAKQTGISEVATNRLISMIAPVFAGYLGKKMVKENWSMAHLMNEIEKQKSTFTGFIPTPLIKSFGLSNVLATGQPVNAKTQTSAKKKNNGWIVWVVIIVLLLLLFWAWRSCRNNRAETVVQRSTVTTVAPGSENDMNRQNAVTNNNTNRESTEVTLPGNVRINVYRGGVEEQMVNFLQSNDYRNASDSDLRNRWFVFDNINFEFNSSSQLMSGSTAQLDNIAAILKAYPNAKVKIGAFADRVGNENVNLEISQQRAQTIENMLENRGVGNQVVRTQGYGDEYATRSPNASNAERAEDRDIAIRFVK